MYIYLYVFLYTYVYIYVFDPSSIRGSCSHTVSSPSPLPASALCLYVRAPAAVTSVLVVSPSLSLPRAPPALHRLPPPLSLHPPLAVPLSECKGSRGCLAVLVQGRPAAIPPRRFRSSSINHPTRPSRTSRAPRLPFSSAKF